MGEYIGENIGDTQLINPKILIPVELHKRLRIMAILRGKRVNEVVIEILVEHTKDLKLD